ncbi:holo-ACP synthase [Nocardia sp. NPDC051052]|uniref:holo-ACP synthase n=1 Tax=Nocardia sp. NPDC051052 TaxID=3364322 RepID=UPI0037B419B8
MTRSVATSMLLPAISAPAAMTVGVDIAAVGRVRALLGAGNAFAEQVFQPAEVVYCTGFRDPAPHFAARFSAKEATLKALQVGLGLPPVLRRLRDIEICRASGAPRLLLHNRLVTLARRLGISGAAVSLSHDGDYAVAYVLLATEAVRG